MPTDQVASQMSDLNTIVARLRAQGLPPDQIRAELTRIMNTPSTSPTGASSGTGSSPGSTSPASLLGSAATGLGGVAQASNLLRGGVKVPSALTDAVTAAHTKWLDDQKFVSSLPADQQGSFRRVLENDRIEFETAQAAVQNYRPPQSSFSKTMSSPTVQAGMEAAAAAGLIYGAGSAGEDLGRNPTAGKAIQTTLTAVGGMVALHMMLTNYAVQAMINSAATSMFGAGFAGNLAVFLSNPWTAVAIVAAVVIISLFKGIFGSKDKPLSETGQEMKSFTDDLPSWYETLPTTAIVPMAIGLALSGMGYGLSGSSKPYDEFNNIPTAQLVSLINKSGATVDAGTMSQRIFLEKGAGASGDRVMIVTPGSNGRSTVQVFNINGDGYVVGCKEGGPDNCYTPFFRPKVDASGKVVGVMRDPSGLRALNAQAAGLAAASSATDPARAASAANYASQAAHDVTNVPK